MMEDRQKMFKTFYNAGRGGGLNLAPAGNFGVGGTIHQESWSDEEDDEEGDEAEYGGEGGARGRFKLAEDEDDF